MCHLAFSIFHLDESVEGSENPIEVLPRYEGMDGDLEQPPYEIFRDSTSRLRTTGKRLLAIQHLRVRWPRADPVLVRALHDIVPGVGERVLAPHDVLVVRVQHPVPFRWRREPLDLREPLREPSCVLAPLPHEAVELPELDEPDCGGNLRHPLVVPDEDVLVLRRLAVVPQEATRLRDPWIVRDDHPALAARRHVLRRVERKTRDVPEVPRLPAVVLRAVGLARVLDYHEVVGLRDLVDRVHLRGLPVEVDGHHGLRLL